MNIELYFLLMFNTPGFSLVDIGFFGGIALLIIALVVCLILFLKRGKKAPKVNSSEWVEALGGNDNIVSVNAVGSRLTLVLNDKEAINRDKLKTLGVSSVLVMSNKVTLVIEGQAENIAQSITPKN